MSTSRARAARAEATETATTFDFDGESYSVAPSNQWDLDALDAFESGRILTAVRLILGADQLARFRSKPRTIGDLDALFDAAQKAAGISEGN
ncbi:hypothetical protein [Micromonospora okii]|uniref:hypothetical protein n=1 Tax=Micromonospora okii TaxID=1182970 RepID=UPI001E297522|nr:hypothetical protein [Micromonospora okii]